MIKTNFERARIIIDTLLPRVTPLVKGSVDEMVAKRLRQLSRAYGGKLLADDRDPIDYSRLTTQIAYAYRSLAAHGDWVFRALRSAQLAAAAALGGTRAKVACIGGGPGSDILGVMRFADVHDLLETNFEFVSLDHERAWRATRDVLIETYNGEARITSGFLELDITTGPPWLDDWSFADADLFTISFCLSEVWSFNREGSVSGFLGELLDRAKSGALICYVDNGGLSFTPLVEAEIAGRADVELVGSEEEDRMLLSGSEQSAIVQEPYRARFGGQWPKLTGNVAIRVWKKL